MPIILPGIIYYYTRVNNKIFIKEGNSDFLYYLSVFKMPDLPLSRKPLGEFTFEDYIALHCLPEAYVGPEISHIRSSISPRSGHSRGGLVYFLGGDNDSVDRRLWVKQVHGVTDSSPSYQDSRNPELLFTRELRAIKIIQNNVGKDLVPGIVAHHAEYLILFQAYGRYKSDLKRLVEEPNQGKRKAIIFDGHQSIAYFGGRLQARENQFPLSLLEVRQTKLKKIDEIVDQLSVAVRKNQAASDIPPEQFLELVNKKFKIDLYERVSALVEAMDALGYEMVLSHGDCRAQHVLGSPSDNGRYSQKKMVDLDRFGKYPFGLDHVMYASADSGISDLRLSELRDLGGWVLAYRRASMNSDFEQAKRAVKKLKDRSREGRQKVIGTISDEERSRFAIRHLALAVEDHVHLHASNIRYSPDDRGNFIDNIPGWTEQKMYDYRPARIRAILEYAANQAPFQVMEDPKAARALFYRWAELLQKLELVDSSESVLNTLGR